MRILPAAALVLLSACSVAVRRTPPPSAQTAEARVVQAQVDAFNRRDVDAFMATYAADAIHWEYPADTVWNGAARIRAHYAELFADPDANDLHVDVRERIVKGRFVIDHGFYRGLPGEGEHVSVVIYEVVDGRIRNAWFMN
jgi:putative hydrolases of HD superfamily